MQKLISIIIILLFASCATLSKKKTHTAHPVEQRSPSVIQSTGGSTDSAEEIASSSLRIEAAAYKDTDPEKAQSLLREAIAINPHDADSLLDLAELSCFLGDKNEAEGYLERAESLVVSDGLKTEKVQALKSKLTECQR